MVRPASGMLGCLPRPAPIRLLPSPSTRVLILHGLNPRPASCCHLPLYGTFSSRLPHRAMLGCALKVTCHTQSSKEQGRAFTLPLILNIRQPSYLSLLTRFLTTLSAQALASQFGETFASPCAQVPQLNLLLGGW